MKRHVRKSCQAIGVCDLYVCSSGARRGFLGGEVGEASDVASKERTLSREI